MNTSYMLSLYYILVTIRGQGKYIYSIIYVQAKTLQLVKKDGSI